MHFMLKTVFVVATILATVEATEAHPFHFSATEIEWNGESQRFEVAMRLRIADLEDAISAKLKSRFRLENAIQQQEVKPLQDYVREHFALTFAGDKSCRLHWVGCELELHDAWVYFETESIGDRAPQKQTKIKTWEGLFRPEPEKTRDATANLVVRNTVLLEIQKEQLNMASVKWGRQKATLTFHQKQHEQTMKAAVTVTP